MRKRRGTHLGRSRTGGRLVWCALVVGAPGIPLLVSGDTLAAHHALMPGTLAPRAAASRQAPVEQRPARRHPAASTAPPDTTITIRTTGTNLAFSPSKISAKQGTRVRIRFINDGTLPHNIVLVKREDDISMLGRAALNASETGYVPLEHEDRMFAYSALAAPGETVEMTFEVPPAGEYFFVCLYSGHYNMMYGTLQSLG